MLRPTGRSARRRSSVTGIVGIANRWTFTGFLSSSDDLRRDSAAANECTLVGVASQGNPCRRRRRRLLERRDDLGETAPAASPATLRLPEATSSAVRACMMNGGQVCVAWSRVFGERDSYDEAVAHLARQAGSRRMLDPFDPKAHMGPLTTAAQRETVERYVAGAVEEGATVVIGGRRPRDRDRG